MKKIRVANGIFWIEVPEAGVKMLCGCPADSVKHLINRGLIVLEEKEGVLCETGPNVILLSDIPLQRQQFANLAEFPVLQMLYKQGMLIPNHPNNNGEKPIIIGRSDQLKAQMEYIYRGNYGLSTFDELVSSGISEQEARRLLRIKLHFAFGKIQRMEDLLIGKALDIDEIEIKDSVQIRRKSLNVFEVIYRGETVTVDLNLVVGEFYEAPYNLGYRQIKREYFSVIHSGEGDGWDPNRPCMASIISFQGKLYLIDAGPNLLHSLNALGIGVNEIEGIFQTHAHDDHFNGLTALLRAERKHKYFATPPVRSSVTKKLAALLSINENDFSNYFDIQDLTEGVWTSINGLEVMPTWSPHPVETTVLRFRALWEDGYKEYAHLADIVSFDVLKGMVSDNKDNSGITEEYFNQIKQSLLSPSNLKKIDAGGGMIHGKIEDFAYDTSDKIIISHTGIGLSSTQRELGSGTAFGDADTLIPGERNYSLSVAFRYFRLYYPAVPEYELNIILNNPIIMINPGSILIKKEEKNQYIYLILSGEMEFISEKHNINTRLSSGSIAGELSGITGKGASGTFRSISYVSALRIARELYVDLLTRNEILEKVKRNLIIRRFLQRTWLLGEHISCPLKNSIAESIRRRHVRKDKLIKPLVETDESEILLLVKGRISILAGTNVIEVLKPGEFFGSESVIKGKVQVLHARADEDSEFFAVPRNVIDNIPIVQIKIRETYERRIRLSAIAESLSSSPKKET